MRWPDQSKRETSNIFVQIVVKQMDRPAAGRGVVQKLRLIFKEMRLSVLSKTNPLIVFVARISRTYNAWLKHSWRSMKMRGKHPFQAARGRSCGRKTSIEIYPRLWYSNQHQTKCERNRDRINSSTDPGLQPTRQQRIWSASNQGDIPVFVALRVCGRALYRDSFLLTYDMSS